MNDAVLHKTLPDAPWLQAATSRLPGIQPLPSDQWLVRDETFAGQMALRDDLIANENDRVHAIQPICEPAAQECLDLVLENLRSDPGYQVAGTKVHRPDGVIVTIDRHTPLITLGRLVQSDICLMQPGPNEHVLTGAILCFPAGWTLAEKLGRPLDIIHRTVPQYDDNIGQRVQRMFDAIRPDQILIRANAHLYADPDLFTPRLESDPRPYVGLKEGRFVRSERQTLRRLPMSSAVVFGIHTRMIAVEDLSQAQRSSLDIIA